MSVNLRSLIAVSLLAMVVGASIARAADTGGTVKGSLKNTSGEPVAGALVKVRNVDKGFAFMVATQDKGVRVLHGNVQEPEESGQTGFESSIQGKYFACYFLADLAAVIVRLDLEVGLEQIDNRQIRGGLAVGHRPAFHDQPAMGSMRVGELPIQPGLADAGFTDYRYDLTVSCP